MGEFLILSEREDHLFKKCIEVNTCHPDSVIGESFKVTLNDWGVIYSENPRMENFVLLKSDYESVNPVLILALMNVLKHKQKVVEKIIQNQNA